MTEPFAARLVRATTSAVRYFVHIVYVDDAGSTGRDLDNPEQPVQVVVAVIISDEYFTTISAFLRDLHERVRQGNPESTELHGLDLFRKNKEAMWDCLSLVEGLALPVVYGAVDKQKLATQIYSSADPLTMAFQICGDGVSEWFYAQAAQDLGIFIVDKTRQEASFRKVFHEKRRTKQWLHMVDDIFFGDSEYSVGLWLADLCSFVIRRQLSGSEDSDGFYDLIRKRLCHFRIFPE